MASLAELPLECVSVVLRNLDDFRSLDAALLSCRNVYVAFREGRGIATEVFCRQITPALLPYAVAATQAPGVEFPDHYIGPVRDYLDSFFDEPDRFAAQVQTMSMGRLREMARMDETVRHMAHKFASSAWARLSGERAIKESVDLTPSEYFRFASAFYRIQQFYGLFRRMILECDYLSVLNIGMWYFLRLPLWEEEQMLCIFSFLLGQLSEGCCDVVDHDDVSKDFSSDKYWTDAPRELWISQGIECVDQLVAASSPESKRALLDSATGNGHVSLMGALAGAVSSFFTDPQVKFHNTWPFYIKSYRLKLQNEPRGRYDEDAEKGPREVWNSVYTDNPGNVRHLLNGGNACLRDLAYVFWDWDRVERNDLINVFKAARFREEPGDSG